MNPEIQEKLDQQADYIAGKRNTPADFSGMDLRWANLREANLYEANLYKANLREADLRWANLREADLRDVDLREADLRWANLYGANLYEANIDFSCWPLWCGSVGVKVDSKIAYQLAVHLCAVTCDNPEVQAMQKALLPWALRSHRAADCGLTVEKVEK